MNTFIIIGLLGGAFITLTLEFTLEVANLSRSSGHTIRNPIPDDQILLRLVPTTCATWHDLVPPG